ncbi:hypothetical protein P7D43_14755 [Enterococcus avium]|uniref:Uncharacterized protein n=1 Tax=Enterococcus avium TaxID=33945 RepID=A0AAW8RUE5_ENTAV|nr:hypothetical protein [Enterococcus avium]MDT2403632.1 hypothetical protein [Enterococcus avium]
MKLIDYIHEGYNIVTSECLGRAIRQSYPATFVFTGGDFEKIPRGKLLVDSFYSYLPEIRDAIELQKAYAVEQFTNDFVGAEAGVRSMKLLEQSLKYLNNKQEPNLLEIKLKDTDSVPEVLYRGERLDELPKGLIDVSYHWKTDDFTNDDRGVNDITIEYYDSHNDKYLDRKIIGHKRDM